MENIATIAKKQQNKLDVAKIRADFPCLNQKVYDQPLVYLDNAATTQKPIQVIEAIKDYYCHDNSNVHRGVHLLSQRATDMYEATRHKVKVFINAISDKEIVFTRGSTESINLVAQSYGRAFLTAGDEIIISQLEHHSNIVPWQLLSQQTGVVIKVIPIDNSGELIIDEYKKLLNAKTKLVAVGHISNAFGTINPVKEIIKLAHEYNALVLLDGAQAAPHTKIDVQDLDCDFYVFSGHKVFGPTGIGILYARKHLLEKMPPYQGGGEMIKMVSLTKSIYNDVPHKFEAGTPNIAGVAGLGSALDYVMMLGIENIRAYEQELLYYANQVLQDVPGIKFIGTAKHKASIISFTLDYAHAHDIGTILDHQGIAIRTGHHCAMPAMEYFGVAATARASLAFYNTMQEIDALRIGLDKVKGVLD